MRRQVPVIPLPDGTLIVSCGEDELEVVIVKRVEMGFRVEGVQLPQIAGPGRIRTPIYINPNDQSAMLARPEKFDTASTHSMLIALGEAYRNPGVANPTSLVVGPAHGIDLHGAVNFAGQMQTHFPGVEFSIDLGLARHLK